MTRSRPLRIRGANFGMSKIGASRFDFHDPYHLAVSLSWPAFALVLLAAWLGINLAFALLYVLSPGDIANSRPGSFLDAFFFSIETLATVGYGVMAPSTTYGHIISATEIVVGMAFTAIVTGLLFVRFSRPQANIVYSDDAVVTSHNGRPTLMLRAVNRRLTVMTGATARVSVLLAEATAEGASFRRNHDLKLRQSVLPVFFMPWMLMHEINEASPLHGHDAESLAAARAILFLSIDARDTVLATTVSDVKHYTAEQIRFGVRFADSVSFDDNGHAIADLSRISLLEPDGATAPAPPPARLRGRSPLRFGAKRAG
jgi:inward rectifier potassium channel